METVAEQGLTDVIIPRAPVSPEAVTLAPRRLRIVRPPKDPEAWASRCVVGMAVHNNAKTLRRALQSAMAQIAGEPATAILILDDRSDDGWEEVCADLLGHPRVIIVRGHCGSPARARNAILDLVDAHFPQAEWVARLDGDDAFATPESLSVACDLGRQTGALFVLGGNRLSIEGRLMERTNPASTALLDSGFLLRLLEQMANGEALNELPSCNLLLRTQGGLRYPDVESAEDHLLVTRLLILNGDRAAILEKPFFIDYSLDGDATALNRRRGKHGKSRAKLYQTALTWARARTAANKILGVGSEAIVIQAGSRIEKHFYPYALNLDAVQRLTRFLERAAPLFPRITFQSQGSGVVGSYDAEETCATAAITELEAKSFLRECERCGIVCLDIKRSNFRRRLDGSLVFVDFGADIRDFTVDFFLDSAARLYAIAKLGWLDDELKRRKTGLRPEEAFARIPGFSDFYGELLNTLATDAWGNSPLPIFPKARRTAHDVTLLIKCCAMDARDLAENVRHIVSALGYPVAFSTRVLLIDPHQGPFLRQYHGGDEALLRTSAAQLRAEGWIDEIWVAPNEPAVVAQINQRWFGLATPESHSVGAVPVSPQIWAFDRVSTRYVLQCDVDVLIGRTDWEHAFLDEMLSAITEPRVVGIAFNIPRPQGEGVRPYQAPPGAFVPEVRCGLLDCERIRNELPLPNALEQGRLKLTWYRSLEQRQITAGLKTLRGGDPRSFYLHPANTWKHDVTRLARVRERLATGSLPACQAGAWSLAGEQEDWQQETRSEGVIVLIKGRNTPPARIARCFRSLRRQSDQSFGVIAVDDNSTEESATRQLLAECATWGGRLSYIRNSERRGHLANIDYAIKKLCDNHDSLVVNLDMDDAFMSRDVIRSLEEHRKRGHDLIWAAPFRPEKPFKSYYPWLNQKPGMLGGDDVWIHLRSFRCGLYYQLDVDRLMLNGKWISECTDYALMVPLAELAQFPVYINRYLYWHERCNPSSEATRVRKDLIIKEILKKVGSSEHHCTSCFQGASASDPRAPVAGRSFIKKA